MAEGTVLVIEDDEWVAQLLAAAIRDAGYEVALAHTARDGIERACELEPDCIVCDADLPDETGHFVVRTVRTHPTRVSVTPFVFLSEHDDEASRLEGFQVGADVYMTKPFRVDEVVAQVGALVHMAVRLRRRRDTLLSIPPMEGKAFEGDLGQMSIATVLTVLEIERRSGTFEVVSKKRKASLEVTTGFLIGATIGGSPAPPLDALRMLLGWNVGRFSFALVEAPQAAPSGTPSIGTLLLEAARLEDEGIVPPSMRSPRQAVARQGAPTLGGRAASEDDLAPPSSRGLVFTKSARGSVPPPAPGLRAPLTPRFSPAPTPARPRATPAPRPAPPVAPARMPSLDDEWESGPLSQRGSASVKPGSNRPPRAGSNRPPRPPGKVGTQEPKK